MRITPHCHPIHSQIINYSFRLCSSDVALGFRTAATFHVTPTATTPTTTIFDAL